MITAEQVLDEAGQILSDPNRWMKGKYSNGGGFGLYSDELAEASAYCSLGAIREVYRRHGLYRDDLGDDTPPVEILREVLKQAGMRSKVGIYGDGPHVHIWNDAAEHSEVMKMFEKARALAAEMGL